MNECDFTAVTEAPGQGATSEQIRMLHTRYELAARLCRDRDVLEVACGCGIGLGYLARHVRSVIGADIDRHNLSVAEETYRDDPRVDLMASDAHRLPLADESLDSVVLFEAIYYLDRPVEFVAEARRVLRDEGTLLICTVNCQWPGFNPSPHSVRYYTARQLHELLAAAGFSTELWLGFPDRARSPSHRAVAALRRAAIQWKLIPGTMRGKERLKRVFYGRLEGLPKRLDEHAVTPVPLESWSCLERSDPREYKVLYAVAKKRKRLCHGA